MAEKSVKQLDKVLEDFFKQLPPLPANAVSAIFKITPWLALIFGILGVLGAISAFSLFSVLTPFAMMGGANNWGLGIVASIGWLVSSIMMLLAFPGLKAGKMGGWNLLFWSELVNIVTSIIGISIGSVIGAAIALYLLYQIKPKYK